MTAENCLFHGSRDCPAAREFDSLDWQINRRLHAEQVIRETRDALTALLGGGSEMGAMGGERRGRNLLLVQEKTKYKQILQSMGERR